MARPRGGAIVIGDYNGDVVLPSGTNYPNATGTRNLFVFRTAP